MNRRAIYFFLTLALGVLACMAITVGITISVIDRQDRKIAQQDRQQQEDGRRATCAIVRTMLAVYREDTGTPMTEIRRNVIEAWEYIGHLAQCEKG